MPKVQDPMGTSTQKAGAVHHIRFALDQRVNENGIFNGIVFQISVLNDDIVTGCLLNSAAKGGALTKILRLQQRSNLGMPILQFGQNLARTIARKVDRKSTRLNSSHRCNSYAVFCLKKKKKR